MAGAANHGAWRRVRRRRSGGFDAGMIRQILVDTFRSPAISALLLGHGLGVATKPTGLYEGFYELLFHGLLSILMLIMGMEAWQRLHELRKVAHAYVLYGLAAPIDPRADRVRCGRDCPPPDGLFCRRGGAAVCHGCFEL
jgi:hypothetical protein